MYFSRHFSSLLLQLGKNRQKRGHKNTEDRIEQLYISSKIEDSHKRETRFISKMSPQHLRFVSTDEEYA